MICNDLFVIELASSLSLSLWVLDYGFYPCRKNKLPSQKNDTKAPYYRTEHAKLV
jgi:hypothetical protein